MAVDDDAVRKNPFRFNLSELLPTDEAKRVALSKSQQKRYLQFIRDYGNENSAMRFDKDGMIVFEKATEADPQNGGADVNYVLLKKNSNTDVKDTLLIKAIS